MVFIFVLISLLMLSGREAAVNEVETAGTETRAVGGEEVHKLGHFVGVAGAATGIVGVFGLPHRVDALAGALRNLVEKPVDEGCVDGSRADGVDPYALGQ